MKLRHWNRQQDTHPAGHVHDWSRWQDAEATHHSPLFPRLGTWVVPIQIRRCETCNEAETRDM